RLITILPDSKCEDALAAAGKVDRIIGPNDRINMLPVAPVEQIRSSKAI
ncbi:hypothetical protein L915_06985, partial [Phytophthora nicotianae]